MREELFVFAFLGLVSVFVDRVQKTNKRKKENVFDNIDGIITIAALNYYVTAAVLFFRSIYEYI